ncbi:transcriptional regulator GlxA family with amidase domain [Aminobacter lissarensis]|uniref:Transcriptional regulator GlxA family with amidase domain n=1 Tax=Aminobacter carboxidus TaxID=376165 RepID=A0A8E2BFU5_9HYPH|nr:helix-turn-helix domain-containing protein [Aminobacter lissarensis]MBB6468355.1 transcriptional regulator GlxA family with amidase domain [Aminobacter lissarensis]
MTVPRRVPTYVVLPARTLLLDVAGPMEALRYANRLQPDVQFDVTYVGALPEVTTSIGLRVTGISPLPETIEPGAMVVLAGDTDEPMDAGQPFEAADEGSDELVQWLRRSLKPGILLVSICSGALLAGRAGLLDGVKCTTHFTDCKRLARIAPLAKVLENRLYVEDGERYTSAGITAGIDLMLHIIGRLTNQAVSAAVAKSLVVYFRRLGTDPQLSPWLEGRNHIHAAIHRVQDAITADPARDWSLTALADIAITSPRHLSRLFNDQTGMSIPSYLNRLRVALAQQLLNETRLDMERVAERVGYSSSRQLRRAWGRFNATPPSALRREVAYPPYLRKS